MSVTLVLAMLTLLGRQGSVPGPADAFSPPLKEFAALADLKRWVNEHKGFGAPESIDFDLNGVRLYVAWDCPFSGRAANVSWTYFRSTRDGKWHLLDTGFHQDKAILSYVYVDRAASSLIFVSITGHRLKAIDLKPILYK